MPRFHEHPTLLQISARLLLGELAVAGERPPTLADVPDARLDAWAALGFDFVYLLGVWTLGAEGPAWSRTDPGLRREYDELLPGWNDADVCGSPFAVARYAVDPALGGEVALAAFRERLARRGVGLVVDFVPNHTARDHVWLREHPEVYARDAGGDVLQGRDPHFPAWPDTAQLDLRRRATHALLVSTILQIAAQADGVRCDMAMLVVGDVFARTWPSLPPPPTGEAAAGELWVEAIDAVRRVRPDFVFIAEAYWDLEWRLQLLGFDYTYDKRLYDRLLASDGVGVRAHLSAAPDFQRRCVRFLENHDEPRIASRLSLAAHRAAAVVAFTVPGMRFFHDGELDGRRARASVHLGRRRDEPCDEARRALYGVLLATLRHPAVRGGSFAQLEATGGLVAHRWHHHRGSFVVVVNLAAAHTRASLVLDLPGLAGRRGAWREHLSGRRLVLDGDELVDPSRGLALDLPGWGAMLLETPPSAP